MNRGAWQAIYSSWGRKESDMTERLLPSFQLCERASMGAPTVKDLPANAGDACLIPGLRRYFGGGNGNPLQYSCLGNPIDRGASWATLRGVTKESGHGLNKQLDQNNMSQAESMTLT